MERFTCLTVEKIHRPDAKYVDMADVRVKRDQGPGRAPAVVATFTIPVYQLGNLAGVPDPRNIREGSCYTIRVEPIQPGDGFGA